MRNRLMLLPGLLSTAACAIPVPSGIVDNHTKSSFDKRAVTAPQQLGLKNGENEVFSTAGGQIGFAVGQKGDDLVAVVGIADAAPGPAPASGTVTYAGEWGVGYVDDLDVTVSITGDTNIDYTDGTDEGDISLTADFGAGTLLGQGDSSVGSGRQLVIDGEIDGGTLSGEARYNGRAADLTGEVGSEAAIGAFQDNDGHGVLVGGFSAVAD